MQQWKMELSGIYLFLTCNLIESHKVCPQRPVFDTIAILCIHRNGRKHKTVLERILAQKNKGKRNALDEDADAVGPKRASLKRKSMSGAQEAPLVTSTRNTVTETLKSATPTVSPQTAAPAPTISPNLYQQINPSAPPSDSTPYYCYYPGPYYPYYPYSYGNYYYPTQVSTSSDLSMYSPFSTPRRHSPKNSRRPALSRNKHTPQHNKPLLPLVSLRRRDPKRNERKRILQQRRKRYTTRSYDNLVG